MINGGEVPFHRIDDYSVRGKELIVESLCILGTVNMKKGEKVAIIIISKAREIADRYSLNMVSPYFLEGVLLMEDGKFDKARKSLDRVIEIRGDYAEALNVLGICHHNMGNSR